MATRIQASKKNAAFLVSRNWQIAFTVVTITSWFLWLIYLLIWSTKSYFSAGTWVFQISQTVFPLLWFGIALWFSWSRYASRLHKVFSAAFITAVGYGLFQLLSTLENTLHYRFYPPVIADPSDHSLFTAFGHDWLVMAIGLVVFVGLITGKKYTQKRR